MPEIPEEAVQAVAEKLYQAYDSEFDAAHLSWQDFAEQARELLEVAAPALREPLQFALPLRPGHKQPQNIYAQIVGKGEDVIAAAFTPEAATWLITMINKALEAATAAPSASETPVERMTGSQDDPTSKGLSDALVLRAEIAHERAEAADAGRTDAMRAALAAVLPHVVKQERAAIISGIKHYFSPVGDELWGDVQTLIGRIERGEYGTGTEKGGRDA